MNIGDAVTAIHPRKNGWHPGKLETITKRRADKVLVYGVRFNGEIIRRKVVGEKSIRLLPPEQTAQPEAAKTGETRLCHDAGRSVGEIWIHAAPGSFMVYQQGDTKPRVLGAFGKKEHARLFMDALKTNWMDGYIARADENISAD